MTAAPSITTSLSSSPSISNIQFALANISDLPSALPTPIKPKPPTSPTPPSPPPPFDPSNPEALIATTKSFIATDFGIQTLQVPSYSTEQKRSDASGEEAPPTATTSALPYYSSSLLSDNDFLWVSGNNVNDRTGLLNKEEYLAAGRFFNLRRSFPDLEYRAHDFRVIDNESGEYTSGSSDDSATITVRFTTLTTGTFRGAPLRLRHSTIQPNGKVMKCPPTSISITYATKGRNAGKIVKLVNDVVLDRQFGNTKGLSGIAGAAICAGVPLNEWELSPPLVAMGKFFGRPMKQIDEQSGGDVGMPPFPDSVMIQLAKGVTASSFGLDDPDLLSIDFTYLEPLMGPLKKEAYVELFTTKYNVRDAVPDLDYQFQVRQTLLLLPCSDIVFVLKGSCCVTRWIFLHLTSLHCLSHFAILLELQS